jgi:hypothetical protein
VDECLLCGAPGGTPYCGDACEAADYPDEEENPMSIKNLVDQVEATVKLGTALGRTGAQIAADVTAIVGDLPPADAKAVHARLADDIANQDT